MRREFSGSVADAVVASGWRGSFGARPAGALLLVEGETVGKSPDGSVGVVKAPLGSGGSDVPGSVSLGTMGAGGGEVELAATTSIVASAWKEVDLPALAVAVSVICSPADAASRTRTPATSSSAWLVGRSPTVQTSPSCSGHTENFGASTFVALPTLTVTVAPALSAPVLHTHIA